MRRPLFAWSSLTALVACSGGQTGSLTEPDETPDLGALEVTNVVPDAGPSAGGTPGGARTWTIAPLGALT